MTGDSCPAMYGHGVDIRTAEFGFLADDCGTNGTVCEILAFFRAPADGDEVDDDNVLLAHELEVPVGSPIDDLAQAICDDPGTVNRVGEHLRGLIAACSCAGYEECPALSAPSVVTAMELAVGGRSPA